MVKNPQAWTLIPNIDPNDVELKSIQLAVVVPEASINYFPNPSAEVNTNWFYSKVAPARDNTVNSAYGRYALKMTPLDTNYTQALAVPMPDFASDLRLAAASRATVSFEVYGTAGEQITATIENAGLVDFFNRTGTLNGFSDDRGRDLYTASAGLTLQNSRVEATALTNKIKAYINSFGNNGIDGTFEADVRGIFTSVSIGAWPVLLLTYNPTNVGGESWIGVRLEQGLVRLLTYGSTVETSLTTGAFTFVTGVQYNVKVVSVATGGGAYSISVYINNTLVISNFAIGSILSFNGFNAGIWLTVVGAPAGVNPYWDNLTFRPTSPLASKSAVLTSDYQRLSLSFGFTTGFRPVLFVQKTGTLTMNPLWIDAVSFEMKAYATTYFDGDFGGTWDGLPNQSSSTRQETDGGGKILYFKRS
jgi:hypothetical protein